MDEAPGLGWWQATDGQWYPPELHPYHRAHGLAPPEPAHLVHHARHVHPAHVRPGAGDYTVEPVTSATRGFGLLLAALAVLLATAVITGGVVLLIRHGGM